MAGFANLLTEVLLSHVLPSLGSCLKNVSVNNNNNNSNNV